jgi:hypothetical protein
MQDGRRPLWGARVLLALCFLALSPGAAQAQGKDHPCRTAEDDAEISKLDQEWDNLNSRRNTLDYRRSNDDHQLRRFKGADPDRDAQLTKAIADSRAESDRLKTEMDKIKSRIEELKALPPCPHWTTPQPAAPPPTPKPVPPPPAPPRCRTAEDDAEIKRLDHEWDVLNSRRSTLDFQRMQDDEDLRLMKAMAEPGPGRRDADPAEVARLTKAIADSQAESDRIRTQQDRIKSRIQELQALPPCPHWTTPQPPRTATPPPLHETPPADNGKSLPKKHPKRRRHAVSEDDPRYMENYQGSGGSHASVPKRDDEEGSPGPVPDDQSDRPAPNDAPSYPTPEIPGPH